MKEILLKMEINFTFSNEIQKSTLIIGLKKNLRQNFILINLAKQRNIPIYTLDEISFYQANKLIQFLRS